jgi:methylenetetrahydrofolate dehydrogenase (NAD+)
MQYNPHHVSHPASLSLQECLALSDVVVSAVPTAEYKVKTAWLKDGCVCVNVAADKNFEKDVREKVGVCPKPLYQGLTYNHRRQCTSLP